MVKNKKLSIVYVGVVLLFLTIPFGYFYLNYYHKTIFDNSAFTYLLIVTLSILFALFMSKRFIKNVRGDIKEAFFRLFIIAISIYASFLFLMTISNYNRMVSQSIDVQYYHTELWKLSAFQIPSYEWSQHFEPILFFLAPLYWVVKIAGILMLLQVLIFISGVIPLYLTVKKHIHSRFIGLSLAFAYLAFGGTQFGIAYGFHPIMFFPTIFMWMYYFYCEKRIKLYLLFVLLSLFVKEEVAFIMLFWGVYLLFIKRDRMLGAATVVFGLIWYIVCFKIIFPIYAGGGGFGYWGQYNQTQGVGIIGLSKFVILQPLDFLKTLVTPSFKIDTFFQSFGSFGFLLFLFPQSFIIVLPSLLEKLLSNNIAAMNGTHYSAALTGVTLVATIETLSSISKNKYLLKYVVNINIFLGILIFYMALFFNMLYGYYAFSLMPTVHRTGYVVGNAVIDPSEENLTLLSHIIDTIPEQASIAAQDQIIPHIHKHFTLIRDIPNNNENSDYVLVDTQLPPPVLKDTRLLNQYLEGLDKNKKYQLIFNNLGIALFKKITQ